MSATTIISVGELRVEFVSHATGCALSELAAYSGPYPGGAVAISLDQAARMGAQTKIFGGIGEDGFGCALVERLAESGVDTSGLALHGDKATGVAFVSEFDDASRSRIVHVNNTAAEWAGKVVPALPSTDLLLHVSGASLVNARLRALILTVCDEVLARGGRISCDLDVGPELMAAPKAVEALHKVMALSSILFCGSSDLALLYPGKSEEAAVAALRSSGADIVARKCGVDGAVVLHGDARYDFAGHDVDNIDPSGAGESFCGTFLAMFTQGHSVEIAARYANAAGALAAAKRGPMEGNSSLEELDALLSGQQMERMRA